MKNTIAYQIKELLAKTAGVKMEEIFLEHPENLGHGDYATNIAMVLAKKKKQKPRELAEKIVAKIPKTDFLEKIEVAGPGFINFWLSNKILTGEPLKIIEQGLKYGSFNVGQGKTAIIDYSSPNIAKRFTIGHLRSTIIGQVLYNLYQFCGWKVIGDNHLGDWGTQFGKMIVAVRKWAKKPISKLSIDEMEELYVKFHEEVEKDSCLDDLARQAFKNLEDGKNEERKIWRQLVDASMQEFQKIYHLLGVKIDVAYGESFYEEMMPAVIKEAKKKKAAVKSKGALVVLFPRDKLPPAMLLKSDGATTYFTRDLATIKFRKEKWQPELVIYEVGSEQSLHFKQVFWAAELLGWAKREDFFHVPHGLIRLKEGKMSTRKGRTIKLEKVLQEAMKKASKFNDDPEISRAVGIGAVKYNDLKRSPTSGYVFDWKEILNLEGNSGPYLQYTYARCKSVLAKTKDGNYKLAQNIKLNEEELAVLRRLYRFPEIIIEAAEKYSPNLICNFLFDLAQKFNVFYNKHRILKPDSSEESFRLGLTAAVAQTLENGLKLLGLETPKKM